MSVAEHGSVAVQGAIVRTERLPRPFADQEPFKVDNYDDYEYVDAPYDDYQDYEDAPED